MTMTYPESRNLCSCSNATTLEWTPEVAATWQIPCPMRPKPTQATVSNPDDSTDDSFDSDGEDEKKAAVPLGLKPTKAAGRRFNTPKVVVPTDAIDFDRKDMEMYLNGNPVDLGFWRYMN